MSATVTSTALRVINGDGHSQSDRTIHGDALASDIAVRNYMQPLKKHLAAHGATGLWINRPGQLVMRVGASDVTIEEPALTFSALEAFAQAVAVFSPQQQQTGFDNPILSATLPDGERIQIVLPPVMEPGMVSISIRIPGDHTFSFDEYAASGFFSKFVWPKPKQSLSGSAKLSPEDRKLVELLNVGNLRQFLVEAVQSCQNIGIVGDTGSGKTMLMKSMCSFIPVHERLITIEDTRELHLPLHTNKVQMLYSKAGQSVGRVTPSQLIASCFRMDPSRVLMAELRSGEAWDFLKLLTSGHRGAMTSWHAESNALASERFMFMCKENAEAATLARDELKTLVSLTVDILIHVTRRVVYNDAGQAICVERYVDEVFFDPWSKMDTEFGDKELMHGASKLINGALDE